MTIFHGEYQYRPKQGTCCVYIAKKMTVTIKLETRSSKQMRLNELHA